MADQEGIILSTDGISIIRDNESEIEIDNIQGKSCEISDVPKMKVIDYGIKTTYQCGRFSVLVLLTISCLALVFYIIIDSHIQGDRTPEWAIPLLTFVIGIWVPSPTWSKKKQAIQSV